MMRSTSQTFSASLVYAPAVLSTLFLATPAVLAKHHQTVIRHQSVPFWQSLPSDYWILPSVVIGALVLYFLFNKPDCKCRCGMNCKCKCKCSASCPCIQAPVRLLR